MIYFYNQQQWVYCAPLLILHSLDFQDDTERSLHLVLICVTLPLTHILFFTSGHSFPRCQLVSGLCAFMYTLLSLGFHSSQIFSLFSSPLEMSPPLKPFLTAFPVLYSTRTAVFWLIFCGGAYHIGLLFLHISFY